MTKTSIPVNTETKDRLDELKREDETWDEFLRRIASDDEPIQKNFLSDEAVDAIEDNVRQSRESF
jgi:hypothetical protein